MKLETTFSLGDEVFLVLRKVRPKTVTCKFCSGTGLVIGKDGTTDNCPRCRGSRSRLEYDAPAWCVRGPFQIGLVRVEAIDSPGLPGEDLFDNYKPRVGRKEEYMLVETGIGTGSVYTEEHLCSTEAEAAELAERLNALTAEGERFDNASIAKKSMKGKKAAQ